MEQVTSLSFEALKRYFNSLSKLGYRNDKEVIKLIILIYIEEVLANNTGFITEEEYNILISTLNCLASSTCLIDFPSYYVYDDIIHKTLNNMSPLN